MSSSISFYRLGDIAEISKGIWLNSKTAKNLSRDHIEEQYGVKKNDVVIARKVYSTGKKYAALVENTTVVLVPSGASLIIRPDTAKLFPLYLKAFLEFLPSDIVIKELKLTSKKHLLSKGSLSKLLVPLPPVTEQIALSDKYDKVKTVDFYHRYANPIIEQHDSLMNFFGLVIIRFLPILTSYGFYLSSVEQTHSAQQVLHLDHRIKSIRESYHPDLK